MRSNKRHVGTIKQADITYKTQETKGPDALTHDDDLIISQNCSERKFRSDPPLCIAMLNSGYF